MKFIFKYEKVFDQMLRIRPKIFKISKNNIILINSKLKKKNVNKNVK